MRNIIIPLALLMLFSCGEAEKQYFRIDDCAILNAGVHNNGFTIFCYIDSAECNICVVQWLHRWTYFEDDLKEMKVGVVLIVRNSDEDAVRKLMDFLRLDFPIIFDKSATIRRQNRAMLRQHSVFVVNNKKEVVWLGLPIESRTSWNSFRRMIRRY